jgi:hypothetical protein
MPECPAQDHEVQLLHARETLLARQERVLDGSSVGFGGCQYFGDRPVAPAPTE